VGINLKSVIKTVITPKSGVNLMKSLRNSCFTYIGGFIYKGGYIYKALQDVENTKERTPFCVDDKNDDRSLGLFEENCTKCHCNEIRS
jgi:hypothetical protein